jgi:hypothetical protein
MQQTQEVASEQDGPAKPEPILTFVLEAWPILDHFKEVSEMLRERLRQILRTDPPHSPPTTPKSAAE